MQSAVVFVALIAAASASSVVYSVPSQSAVINSQRLGGNFAYNVAEGQTYLSSPVLSYSASPVASSSSLVGPSGIVQNVQYKNGQQLTYQAQAVPVSQQSIYGVNGQVVRSSPVVASTYSVPAQSLYNGIQYPSVYGQQYVGQQVLGYGQQIQYV